STSLFCIFHLKSTACDFFIQIPPSECLSIELVNSVQSSEWCEKLYQAKSAELILYGRALGLSHSEAEDVLQETFLALMRSPSVPDLPEHYCFRTFRNRALNYRRGLWRRLKREIESARWFEQTTDESPFEKQA